MAGDLSLPIVRTDGITNITRISKKLMREENFLCPNEKKQSWTGNQPLLKEKGELQYGNPAIIYMRQLRTGKTVFFHVIVITLFFLKPSHQKSDKWSQSHVHKIRPGLLTVRGEMRAHWGNDRQSRLAQPGMLSMFHLKTEGDGRGNYNY